MEQIIKKKIEQIEINRSGRNGPVTNRIGNKYVKYDNKFINTKNNLLVIF